MSDKLKVLDMLQLRFLVFVILVVGPFYSWAAFSPTQDIASERIQYQVIGGQNNQFGWEADYNIGYSASTMSFEVDLNLGLLGAGGYVPESGLIDLWESGIESKWSQQYFVLDSDSTLYSVNVNADLFTLSEYLAIPASERPAIHHVVNVTDGVGAVDLNNWYTNPVNPFSQGQLAAHEIGHLLGNFDEYPSGGVDPNNAANWNVYDSLMGGGLTDTLYDRHFQFILDWIAGVENQPVEDIGFSLVAASQLSPPAQSRYLVPSGFLLRVCLRSLG